MNKLMAKAGVLLMLLLLALPGAAREAEGLYRAEVPVQGQSRDERLEVYGDALSQVLVKITGNRDAAQLPQLAKLMEAPQNLVQQYLYQELDSPLLKDQGYTRKLVVRFDERALGQALVAAGVPLWGRTRPDLLVWLALDDAPSRLLLGSTDESDLAAVLRADAERRGLPLLLPSLDAEDSGVIGFADIWGNFRQPIMAASKRYGANAVLVGRINRLASGHWQGRWSLYQGEDAQHWMVDGEQRDDVVAAGINGVADRFAQRYAQLMTAKAANQTQLLVTGVTTTAGYGRAMQYLLSLDLVTKVEVAKIEGDTVLFTLAVRGDPAAIDGAVALSGTLRRAPPNPDNPEDQTLVYQLLP